MMAWLTSINTAHVTLLDVLLFAVMAVLMLAFGGELAVWTIQRNRSHATYSADPRNLAAPPRVQTVRPPRHPGAHRMSGSPVLIDGGSRP